jgi:hypothetical protein
MKPSRPPPAPSKPGRCHQAQTTRHGEEQLLRLRFWAVRQPSPVDQRSHRAVVSERQAASARWHRCNRHARSVRRSPLHRFHTSGTHGAVALQSEDSVNLHRATDGRKVRLSFAQSEVSRLCG